MVQMNTYISMQCRNMIAILNTFEQSCKLAAQKDDGTISHDEEKILKKIHAAAEKFKKELSKIE